MTTHLAVWDSASAGLLSTFVGASVTTELAHIGVGHERWSADRELAADAGQDDILAAYRAQVDGLMERHGFRTADVIRMAPTHPDRAALRAKFLDEHTHGEPEVRFFVEGRGLFVLHPEPGDRVYGLYATRGDLVFLPAGLRHWFDMGEHPQFCAIRLFTNPEGWVAKYTGDPLAARFPRLPA